MEDRRGILRDESPFSYKLVKDGKALVYWQGAIIKTLVGKEYAKLLREIDARDPYSLQLFLAKATGHFKHGNES